MTDIAKEVRIYLILNRELLSELHFSHLLNGMAGLDAMIFLQLGYPRIHWFCIIHADL